MKEPIKLGSFGPRMHILKTWESPFRATERGEKLFEFRKNDRDYRVGDHLLLRLWSPEAQLFADDLKHVSGVTWILVRVDYVLVGLFGVPEGYAVLSLSVLDKGGPRS